MLFRERAKETILSGFKMKMDDARNSSIKEKKKPFKTKETKYIEKRNEREREKEEGR